MSVRMKAVAVLLAVAAAGGPLAACSGGGTTAAAPASSTGSAAPEDQRTTDAAVADGLKKIEGIAGQIATTASADKAKASDLVGQIEPLWKPVEGTIKANDQDTYLAFEDAFAVLGNAAKAGDAAAAAKGATAVTTAATNYLAKHSG